MSKRLLCISAVFLAVGIAFIIAGFTSTSAVQVCRSQLSEEELSNVIDLPAYGPRLPPGISPLQGFRPMNPPGPFGSPFRRLSNEVKQNKYFPEICFEQNLLGVGLILEDGIINHPIPLEARSLNIRIIAGLLLIGGLGSFLAMLFYIVAACHATDDSKKLMFITHKRNLTGTFILGVSFTLLLCGLSLFTKENMKIMKNSETFINQAVALMKLDDVPSETEIPKQEFQSPKFRGPPRFPNYNPGRNLSFMLDMSNSNANGNAVNQNLGDQPSSMDISTFISKLNFTQLENELSNLAGPENSTVEGDDLLLNFIHQLASGNPPPPIDYQTDVNPTSSETAEQLTETTEINPNKTISGTYHTRNKRAIPGMRDIAKLMSRAMKNATPYFGYSFYLSWCGVLFHFLAFVFGVVTWRKFNRDHH